MVGVDTRVRPDSFYGVGKAASEALCSLYHDRHGLAVACLRIGSFRDRPTTRRHLSTWLSPGDAVRLVDACLRAPALGLAIVYGISRNTRAWWDLDSARVLGYEPRDDAEDWADEIESRPPSDDDELDGRFVGGEFTRAHQ
jgi:uronate dehydrogenase